MKKFFSKVLQCVKLKKKMDKINFNKFIGLLKNENNNNIFLGVFPVAGIREKKYKK